jgi:hypothetical protein
VNGGGGDWRNWVGGVGCDGEGWCREDGLVEEEDGGGCDVLVGTVELTKDSRFCKIQV